MNVDKLLEAEASFLLQYPDGFASDALQQIRKRHNVDKLSAFAAEALAEAQFGKRAEVLDAIVRIVTRSSMLSLFEKPRFRDFVNGLARGDREILADGYRQLLHGDREAGFDQVLDVLRDGQLAKWSIISIVMYQYRPQWDVFVKPTTTKNVIRQFELSGLHYSPRPSWSFYTGYQAAIHDMKARLHPSLSPNNAAFTGFLMMSTAVGKP